MTPSMSVHTFSRDEILSHIDALADILANCVNGGASVSFMLPFSQHDASRLSGAALLKASAARSVPCWCVATSKARF